MFFSYLLIYWDDQDLNKMVEVVVCMQDWLEGTSFSMFINEIIEELKEFEQETFSFNLIQDLEMVKEEERLNEENDKEEPTQQERKNNGYTIKDMKENGVS
ncbi:hypothetical protein CR513_36024, partial [Mucuna pruriens]